MIQAIRKIIPIVLVVVICAPFFMRDAVPARAITTMGALTQTDDGSTNTGFNLSGRSFSNTAVSGSGASASVTFSGTTATPIVRGASKALMINAGYHTAVDAVDANTVFFLERQSSGSSVKWAVSKTTDGGASLNTVEAVSYSGSASSSSLKAYDANTVFFSYQNASAGITVARSTNGGATFATSVVQASGLGSQDERTSIDTLDGSTVFVSYYDSANADLMLGKSTDGGATWATSAIDSVGSVGAYSSLAAVADSTPGDGPTVYISYYDSTNTALKLAKSTDGGTTWTLSTPDNTTGDTGQWSSLEAIDENNVAIAYYRYYELYPAPPDILIRVVVSTNGGSSWTTRTAVSAASTLPKYISLKATSASQFFLSYHNATPQDLMFTSSSDAGATWGTPATIESSGSVGQWSSLDAVDANTVFISYYYQGTAMRFAASGYSTAAGTYTSGPIDLTGGADITALGITQSGQGNAVLGTGYNTYGQLGTGYTTTNTTPFSVSALTGISAVAAGTSHSLALLANGTVKAWGFSGYGQLGDGTTTQRTTPVTVCATGAAAGTCDANPLANVVAIAASSASNSYGHSLALLADGTVKAWGYNSNYRLGDGTQTNRTTPVTVCATGAAAGTCDANPLSNVVAIAAGSTYSVAVLGDGTVKAWGYNTYGQLGDGTTTQRTTPYPVSGITNAIAVATGGTNDTATKLSEHTLALLADGTVKAWGSNQKGDLGDAKACSATYCSTPVIVPGITNAVAVAAGGGSDSGIIDTVQGGHSLALLADGTVKGWGANNYGQLGIGATSVEELTPVAVSGLSGVISIAASSGGYSTHSLAIVSDGTARAWGYNGLYGLGDGTATNRSTPVTPSGVTHAISIAAGKAFSLFVSGGARAEIAANNDNVTWTYKGVPIQAGRKDRVGLSTLLGSSNQYVRYRLTMGTRSATLAPGVEEVKIDYLGGSLINFTASITPSRFVLFFEYQNFTI